MCPNHNCFLSLADAEEKVEFWGRQYDFERQHSALGNLSPHEFAVLRWTPLLRQHEG